MSVWGLVRRNQKLGQGFYGLVLRAPAIAAAARPGQFVMLRVSHGLDPLLARPFSIHGVEGENLFILYRVVGKGSKLLSLVRPGNKSLSLWGSLGKGFDLALQRPVLVAGGIGMAPLVFAAKELAQAGRRAPFLLGLPSVQGLEGLIRPLQAADAAGQIALGLASEDGSPSTRQGLVTLLLGEALESEESQRCDGVLACGPMPMLKAVAGICAKRGVSCQVSLEAPMACGLGACLGCVIPAAGGGYLRACQEGPVMDAAAVDWQRL
ncbi:dihydroorotate dehydrogenase electron transfer subunit [Desulfarculales bacterium]